MSLFDKLPSSHPDKAIPIGCLAATLYHQGHYSEALDKYKMALDIRRTALGSQHVDYAVTLHNIGIVKATMGNTEDGMKNVYDAMTTFEACFGIRHIRYMAAYRNWTRMKEYLVPQYACIGCHHCHALDFNNSVVTFLPHRSKLPRRRKLFRKMGKNERCFMVIEYLIEFVTFSLVIICDVDVVYVLE